jgi:hypothetical protein
LSLSYYDYASLLVAFFPGIKDSTDPVKFIKEHADKYEGLITVISRSVRPPAPPRTGLDANWRGSGSLFFSARDMHALRLQRNSNWLPAAYEFLEAHIARTMKKVPAHVKARDSIEEYMESYHEDSEKYIEKSRFIETDLLRAGYVAFSVGTGITENVDKAEEALLQDAPLTRNGRLGLPMFTASGFEMSSLENYDTDANSEFFKSWDEQLLFNYASPVPIQNVMATLFTSGIAVFEKGLFEDIGISPGGKVTFNNKEFDALLAPRSISRTGDFILRATKEKVKEVVSGAPDYGKGGYFQTLSGDPINAFDAGMGGSGLKVPSKTPRAPTRTAGVRWDGVTNNHYASAVFATNLAYNTLAMPTARSLRNRRSRPLLRSITISSPAKSCSIKKSKSSSLISMTCSRNFFSYALPRKQLEIMLLSILRSLTKSWTWKPARSTSRNERKWTKSSTTSNMRS